MYCAACGGLLQENAQYCSSCGRAVSSEPAHAVAPNVDESVTTAQSAKRRISVSKPIRWLGIGFLWLVVISQAFMVIAFITTGKKLPPPLLMSFALVCGGVTAVHVPSKRVLWFLIGAVASFFAAAILSTMFRAAA